MNKRILMMMMMIYRNQTWFLCIPRYNVIHYSMDPPP